MPRRVAARPTPASEKDSARQQTSVQPTEPQDARVTGASRSLQRPLLGLNVERGQNQEHPETPAGQHATGSFTGGKDSRNDRKTA
jgi:hypothetical protein